VLKEVFVDDFDDAFLLMGIRVENSDINTVTSLMVFSSDGFFLDEGIKMS